MPKEILVLGEYSTGKTSFINLLLGTHLVPNRLPNQSIPIIKIHGNGDFGLFIRKSGIKYPILSLSEVPENLNSYDFLEICVPDHPILKSGLVIWDTEGINTTFEQHHNRIESFFSNRPTAYMESIYYFTHGVLGNFAIDFLKKWKEKWNNIEIIINLIGEYSLEEAKNTETYIYKTVRSEIGSLPIVLLALSNLFTHFISKNEPLGKYPTTLDWLKNWQRRSFNIADNSIPMDNVIGLHIIDIIKDNLPTIDDTIKKIKKLSDNDLEVYANEGETYSAYELALRAKYNKNYALAEKYFGIAGANGYYDAIIQFMDLYFNVTKKIKDYNIGIAVANKAIELNIKNSDKFYQLVYDESIGIEPDENIKLKELKRNVARGSISALRELIFFYNNQIKKVIDIYTNYKNKVENELITYKKRIAELENLIESMKGKQSASWPVTENASNSTKISSETNKNNILNDTQTQNLDFQQKNADASKNFVEFCGIKMIFVRGGKFKMGSDVADNEKPIHPVVLSSFFISQYPITFDIYDLYCDEMGVPKPSDMGWGRNKMPVINVSWEDAMKFCEWLTNKSGKLYRLPTEAEWEYAAKGGQYSNNYIFSGSNNLDEIAWHSGNSNGKTHPVGLKKPNELNIYDMSGNVNEWCYDWYADDYYKNSPLENPTGPESGIEKVFRGGSWATNDKFCRAANRGLFLPNGQFKDVGFRVVTTL